MSTALQVRGSTKGDRRAANALLKGFHDCLIAKGLTLGEMAAELVKKHHGATVTGVKACLQAKLAGGQLVINAQGKLDRVRRCKRQAAFVVVPL